MYLVSETLLVQLEEDPLRPLVVPAAPRSVPRVCTGRDLSVVLAVARWLWRYWAVLTQYHTSVLAASCVCTRVVYWQTVSTGDSLLDA
eukprot:470868-Rhodomonas_salina.1